MVSKKFIVFCIIATMQLQFASLLRPIKGHKAGSSREVPIPSPTDTDTYWNNLIDNLTEKILGMKHEIELINQAFNESDWKETMIYNLKHKIDVVENEIKKINDNLKDEFDGSKQLIDNLTKKKEMENFLIQQSGWQQLIDIFAKKITDFEKEQDVLKESTNHCNHLIDNLTKKNYILEKEMENILIQQSGWQQMFDLFEKKITETEKEQGGLKQWTNHKNQLIDNLAQKIVEIEKEQGIFKESTNRYSFIGQGVTDFKFTGRMDYHVAKLTGNNAFDRRTGYYQASVKGIYYFAFNGLRVSRYYSGTEHFGMKIKKWDFESGYRRSEDLAEVFLSYNYNDYSVFPISMHATAQLEKGDRVAVYLEKGHLANHSRIATTFTGFLVQMTQN